jgi:hypothetical protein
VCVRGLVTGCPKRGRLAGAVADHLQKGATGTPSLHLKPDLIPAKLGRNWRQELATSEMEDGVELPQKKRRLDGQPTTAAAAGSDLPEASLAPPSPAASNPCAD